MFNSPSRFHLDPLDDDVVAIEAVRWDSVKTFSPSSSYVALHIYRPSKSSSRPASPRGATPSVADGANSESKKTIREIVKEAEKVAFGSSALPVPSFFAWRAAPDSHTLLFSTPASL